MLKTIHGSFGSVCVLRFEMLIGDAIENKMRRINRLSIKLTNGPKHKGHPPNLSKGARRADGSIYYGGGG